jgi:hypothetical protein
VVVLSSTEGDDAAEDDGSDFQQTVERAVERSGFDRTHIRAPGFATQDLFADVEPADQTVSKVKYMNGVGVEENLPILIVSRKANLNLGGPISLVEKLMGFSNDFIEAHCLVQ